MIKISTLSVFFTIIYYLFFQVSSQLTNSNVIEIKRKPVALFYKIKVLLFLIYFVLLLYLVYLIINKKINLSFNNLNLIKLNQEIKEVSNIFIKNKINIKGIFLCIVLFLFLRLLIILFKILKIKTFILIISLFILSIFFKQLLIVYLIIDLIFILFIYFPISLLQILKQSNNESIIKSINAIIGHKWKFKTFKILYEKPSFFYTKRVVLPSLDEKKLVKKGFEMIEGILYLNDQYRVTAECKLGNNISSILQIYRYNLEFFQTQIENKIIININDLKQILSVDSSNIEEEMIYIDSRTYQLKKEKYLIKDRFNQKSTEEEKIKDDFCKYGVSFRYMECEQIRWKYGINIINKFLQYYVNYFYNKKDKALLISYLMTLGFLIEMSEAYDAQLTILKKGYNPLTGKLLTTEEINNLDFGNNPDNIELEQTFKKFRS